MANKKHLRKFGVNESLTARVADVGIIILHSSTDWEIVGCVFFKGVYSIQTVTTPMCLHRHTRKRLFV